MAEVYKCVKCGNVVKVKSQIYRPKGCPACQQAKPHEMIYKGQD